MNLYNHYEEMVKDDSCLYYDSPLGSVEYTRDFILGYFKSGEKQKIIILKLLDYLSQNRLQHMVSAFLLGVYLYDKLEILHDAIDKLSEQLEQSVIWPTEKVPESARKCFLYLWFITCLYHDMGYIFEDMPLESCLCCDEFISGILTRDELESFKGPFNHKDRIPEELAKNAGTYFVNGLEKNIRDKKCIDHGIAAGVLLYKEMGKLHTVDPVVQENKSKLWVGKPILKNHIEHCAWCIICHNIWCYSEDNVNMVKLYNEREIGLSELIFKGKNRFIKLNEHPLLFLLCLVDTIEPVKRSNWDYLKRMSIEIADDKIIINNHPSSKLNLDFILPEYNKKDDSGNFEINLKTY